MDRVIASLNTPAQVQGIHKMRPRFLCISLPAGLMFGVFVFLLRPVSTQKIRNQIYFLDNEGDIVLNRPDNPGSDTVVWEWEPHSGRGKQTVVSLRYQYNGTWSKQWGNGWGNTDKNQEVDVDDHTGNLAITKPRFKWSGLFTLTETHPRNQILKQYEIYGMKVNEVGSNNFDLHVFPSEISIAEYSRLQEYVLRVTLKISADKAKALWNKTTVHGPPATRSHRAKSNVQTSETLESQDAA
ncbi:uncharacterized protein LOC116966233 [Amblyraja radiata]|uniref:uncharacterized protein LOC116966233 n=1 Tax=Amblyraja radiata TaxID=386614 RepID=UPI001402A715|nr:uncharacterized protein LOC116966233 [Amblyraja radiata]